MILIVIDDTDSNLCYQSQGHIEQGDNRLFVDMGKPEIVSVHNYARQIWKTSVFQALGVFVLLAIHKYFYYITQLSKFFIVLSQNIHAFQLFHQLQVGAGSGQPKLQQLVNQLPRLDYLKQALVQNLCYLFEFINLFGLFLEFELEVGLKEEVVGLRQVYGVQEEKGSFEAANDDELLEEGPGDRFRLGSDFLFEYPVVVADIFDEIKQKYNFLDALVEQEGIVNEGIQLLIVMLALLKQLATHFLYIYLVYQLFKCLAQCLMLGLHLAQQKTILHSLYFTNCFSNFRKLLSQFLLIKLYNFIVDLRIADHQLLQVLCNFLPMFGVPFLLLTLFSRDQFSQLLEQRDLQVGVQRNVREQVEDDMQRNGIGLLEGVHVSGKEFGDLGGVDQYYSQADNCFFFLNFRKAVVLSQFRKQDVVDRYVSEKKSAQFGDDLQSDKAREFVVGFYVLDQRVSNFVPAVDGQQQVLVVLKDAGHPVLQHQRLCAAYQVHHPQDKRVDQINFFHLSQEKVNLIKSLMYQLEITTDKFPINIKIFILLLLLRQQHRQEYAIKIKYQFTNHNPLFIPAHSKHLYKSPPLSLQLFSHVSLTSQHKKALSFFVRLSNYTLVEVKEASCLNF